MARNALVIKDADFETNKLTTVDIVTEEIPCTAIALDSDSQTVTDVGSFTLTATVTPSNTTDSIIWTSSDTTVATVANGVVTVSGLGTATITATCGNQTATCAVDASEFTMDVDYGFFKRQNLASYPDLYGYATSKRELLIHSLSAPAGAKLLKNQTSDTTLRYPIMLPANTDVVKLIYGSDMRAGTIYFGWMDSTTSPYPSNYPDNADCVLLDTSNSTVYNQSKTWEYEVPEGADSFAIIVTTNSTDFAETDTPEGIATAKGIVIKCCAASAS